MNQLSSSPAEAGIALTVTGNSLTRVAVHSQTAKCRKTARLVDCLEESRHREKEWDKQPQTHGRRNPATFEKRRENQRSSQHNDATAESLGYIRVAQVLRWVLRNFHVTKCSL